MRWFEPFLPFWAKKMIMIIGVRHLEANQIDRVTLARCDYIQSARRAPEYSPVPLIRATLFKKGTLLPLSEYLYNYFIIT